MNKNIESRIEQLENMVLSLIDLVQERLHIDSWGDRDFLENVREFREGVGEGYGE